MAAGSVGGADAAAEEHRTLAQAIGGMSDDELAALFRQRRDLMRPLPEDLSSLAQRAGSHLSVRLAWRHLTRLQQQVLEVLVALAHPAGPDELLAAMDPAADDAARRAIDEATAGCRGSGLLWQDRRGLRPVSALSALLGPYPCGLDPADRSRRPRIAAYLADPGSLSADLRQAPPGARSALDRLLWGPPRGSLADAERAVSADSASTPVEWLLARDLLVPAGPDSVALPREIALLLRGGRYLRSVALPPGPPVGPGAAAVPDADATGGMHALAATRTSERMLALLDRGGTRVLRSGGIYQRDAAELSQRLRLDPDRAALLADALLRAGLIAPDRETGLWGLTRNADAWRGLPEDRQWAALVLAWRDSPAHPASVGDEPEARALSDSLLLPGVAEIRRLALAIAAEAPPGHPIDPQRLADSIAWRQPRLQDPRLPDLVGELLAEAEELGVLGRGALTGAGRLLTDPAADPAAIAERAAWPALVDRLVLQADLTATAPGPLAPGALRRIERLAELESSGAGTVYRLTAASLQRAFDAGMSTAEVEAELSDLSMTGIPGTLEALIADVGRRHGAIRVSATASVITADDEAVLSAALADRSLAGLRLHRLAAGVAISPAPPGEVTAALRGAGVMAVSAAAAEARPRRLAAPAAVMHGQRAEPELRAAVRAIRAGTAAGLALSGPDRIAPVGPHDLVELLQGAIRDQRPVWLDVADATGTRRIRQVQPLTLRSGTVSGFDQREHRVLGFPLSRIAGAAAVVAPGAPSTSRDPAAPPA